jgi:hypothetical protein
VAARRQTRKDSRPLFPLSGCASASPFRNSSTTVDRSGAGAVAAERESGDAVRERRMGDADGPALGPRGEPETAWPTAGRGKVECPGTLLFAPPARDSGRP